MRLPDRIALVTGASRGIGRAIALELAREGAHVAVNYRKQADAAKDAVAAIEALGRRAVAIQGDISEWAACTAMVAEAERALGPLDVLVANGGIASRPGLIVDLPVEEWHLDHRQDLSHRRRRGLARMLKKAHLLRWRPRIWTFLSIRVPVKGGSDGLHV